MPWDDPLTVAARNYRSPSPPGATLGAEDTDDPFFTRGALDDVPEKGELDYIVGGTGGGDGSVVGDMYDNLGLDTMRTAVRTHNFYRRGSGASGDVGGGSSRASGTISNRAAMLNNRGSGGAWTGDFRSHGVHHSQGSGQSRRDGANLSSDRASSNDVFEAKEETIGNITRQAAARVGDGGSRGSGTRLASLYVCLIPPLLTAVADSPTAGTNLALVFAVCGGLLAFSWGRLVARDMHDLEAKAAREEWVSSRSVAASAGAAALDSDTDGDNDASAAIGDEEDGGAAEEIDGRENDGKHETRALMCCRDDDSGGGGRGAVGSFRTEGNIISSTIEKMTVATNSSSELRSHEEGEPPYGGNCEERQRGEQRKSDGRGGGGGGSNHDCEAGVLATDNVEASADCGDDETPQRQPDGRTRSASCTDTLSGRNQVSTERSSRMRQSERRATGGGRGEEFWNDVDRCGSAANRNARCRVRSCCGVLGRLQYRAIRRSCKRVIVDGRLVDWRHAGLGAAGFTAGLMCFAAQGKFPAWYHMWHSAWHILAMGSTVPLLRARKWGTSGDYPDTPRGSLHSTLSLHGNDKSPIGVGEHRHKTGRQRKGTSWARWGMFFGAGLGGRVETRASYEMVPN